MKIVKLRRYSDNRGSLVENTLEEIVRKSKHFFVSKTKPGKIRGNHFHKKKKEWFYLLQGRCKVVIEDIRTKKREEHTIKGNDNLIILMEPGRAHAFKNVGRGEMILLALINVPLDKRSPDTYSYKVL